MKYINTLYDPNEEPFNVKSCGVDRYHCAFAVFTPRRPQFSTRADHMMFVVCRVAVVQISLRVVLFDFPPSLIQSLLHIHSSITGGMDNGPVRCRSST
jgi:hypothetical protein